MKASYVIKNLNLLVVLMTLTLNSCKHSKNETIHQEIERVSDAKPENMNDDITSEESTTDTAIVNFKADLSLSNVQLKKISDPSGAYTHQISVDITNSGQGLARGFDCVVNYDCPAGTVLSAGDHIVYGGYLSPEQKRTYSQQIRIKCKPIPGILDFKLNADINDDVDETDETNNIIHVRLNVPF